MDCIGLKKEKKMSDRTELVERTAIVVGVLLTFLLAVQGCKKQEPAAQQPPKPPVDQAVTAAKDTAKTTQETAQAVATEAMAAIEQTTCPVMDGNPIDKTLFVEYEGKKVYFCCKECEEKFLADPAQYVAKLPQFQE
jgi:YHS domain-containing protein